MPAQRFAGPVGPELELARRLREVARFVGQIVKAHSNGKGGLNDEAGMVRSLRAYSATLEPWAGQVVGKLLAQVGTSNLKHWEEASVALGSALRKTLANEAIGAVARQLQRDQVELITSLPLRAAERAQRIAREAQIGGQRASHISEAIEALDRTGEVTASRATLIARTEIAKANASFTAARAAFVGAKHYIWRTALDAEVRDQHAELEGEVFAFDDPPDIEGEGPHGPGEIWNCRCFAEPIITGAELDPEREAAYQAAAGYDVGL